MKKLILLALSLILMLSLTACGKISKELKILSSEPSELYTEEEISDAIDAVQSYFKKNFSGCTLTEIGYAGDKKSQGYADFAERINGDEVIVLTSSFEVDSSGGDGSLNPNSNYNRWQWIMARKNGGRWKHVDHGY